MGQVAGYTAADYLIQHASRERRYARVPASTWDAILSHIRDPADAARLADSARSRLLYRYAIPLYRHAADAGDRYAAWRLADLLAERGDLDEAAQILRARADAGDGTPPGGWPSCWPSAATWTRPCRYCAPGPTPATGTPPGGWPSCWPSAATWTGCAPGPTPATGTPPAAGRAAGRARRPGRAARPGRRRRRALPPAAGRAAGQARRPGRSCAPGPTPATGMPPCSWPTAGRARRPGRGRADPARRADAGDGDAAWRLAELLAERGDLERAARPGRRRRRTAAERLAELLAERGDLDGLRARADAGDGTAAGRLADLLAERGDLDGLRARADAGDGHAALRLADLLAERGDLDEAARPGRRRRRYAAGGWPSCWIEQGRGEEAERLRRFGLNPDGSIAVREGRRASSPQGARNSTANPMRREPLASRRGGMAHTW